MSEPNAKDLRVATLASLTKVMLRLADVAGAFADLSDSLKELAEHVRDDIEARPAP